MYKLAITVIAMTLVILQANCQAPAFTIPPWVCLTDPTASEQATKALDCLLTNVDVSI